MAKEKELEYIYFRKEAIGMSKYITYYKNHHSKFIHNSWLLLEDLGKTVVIDGEEYTIWGMWENDGKKCIMMLDPAKPGPFKLVDSKTIANALGFSRMRNLVTGEEQKWDLRNKKGWTALDYINSKERAAVSSLPQVESDEDVEGEWVEDEEEYIDPLIKALQDDLIDEGDISSL